tara:strand:- start:318 stop:503 length:186 start_codon:yes stop_codon:yes gene_type:complete
MGIVAVHVAIVGFVGTLTGTGAFLSCFRISAFSSDLQPTIMLRRLPKMATQTSVSGLITAS